MKMFISVAALILCFSGQTLADEELHYNIINLNASSSKQVENDVMVVVMRAVSEANSATESAARVNTAMQWATEQLKNQEAISHQSLNYQTRPLYQNKQVSGWRVSQQIRLKSTKIETLAAAVGTLQQQLQVVSMQFEISPDIRKQEASKLVVEALGAFRAKANLVVETLQAKDYRLVTIRINENRQPIAYRRGVQAEAMAMSAAPPAVEAGETEVLVSIEGSIQLIF
jgi:predicted secreted protein